MAVKNRNAGYTAEQAAKFKARNTNFPLNWHPRGGWRKKINGKGYYFGKVTPDEALAKYHAERPFLERGEVPPPYEPDALTLLDLSNEFLAAKKTRVASGELEQTTWNEYKRTCDGILAHFGQQRAVASLHPIDFVGFRAKLAEGRKLVGLHNEVNRARCVFKFAFDAGLIDKPVRYGENFRRPDKGSMRKHRNKVGRQDFLPHELQSIIETAKGQLRAMILLGINCGLGNMDCSKLDAAMLDLDGGWLTYPRNKTGAYRRAKLWHETIAALLPYVDGRKSGRVFTTKQLNEWTTTAISHEFSDVLDKLGLQKQQRNFYGLRRSFRTIADECSDSPACNTIMGHTDDKTMGDLYTQHVADERLARASDHVRSRIFAKRGAK